MTIEFESQGSRMLAMSVPNEVFGFNYVGARCYYFFDNGGKVIFVIDNVDEGDVIGLSTDHPEHHEAMKEAGIYTVNPYGDHMPMPSEYDRTSHWAASLDKWQEAQNRTSEIWILLKIKE